MGQLAHRPETELVDPLAYDDVDFERALAETSLGDFIRLGWNNMDPAVFKDNWHIDAIAEHLEAVNNGDITRLIVNIPPRHMKSLTVSVAWNAWTWAQPSDREKRPLAGPGIAFLTMSYAQSLSMRDSVKTRRLIKSRWYQKLFGGRFSIAADQDAKLRFENNHHGYRLASSVDGGATGEGGDIIIIDDPINAKDAQSDQIRHTTNDWFDNTMTTRLNDPERGAFVIIMQRLHEDDLVGHVLADDSDHDWTHLCLPARFEVDHPHPSVFDLRANDGELLWPSRFGEKSISRIEKRLGAYGSAGQLQQRPAPREGGMFKPEWFSSIRRLPHDAYRKVRAWDWAATEEEPGKDPDYTVGCLMARTKREKYIIMNVNRHRGSPLVVERKLKLQAQLDGTKVIQRLAKDPGAAGKSDVQAKARKIRGYPTVIAEAGSGGNKVTRATAFAAACEAGDVFLLITGDPDKDAWIQPFLDELAVFPFGKHDDQVDAAADAFNELALGKATLFDTG